jgi:hypothetical protein
VSVKPSSRLDYTVRFLTYRGTFISRAGNWSTTNIWGKKLANGSFALTFINVGTTSAPPFTCDSACISKLLGREDGGATPVKGARYRVRDIWAKRDLPELVAPLSVSSPTLEAGSGMHMVRLWPAS